MIVDGSVGIQGNGNQDVQSWYHSQEINVLVDSELICREWAEAIRSNQVCSLPSSALFFSFPFCFSSPIADDTLHRTLIFTASSRRTASGAKTAMVKLSPAPLEDPKDPSSRSSVSKVLSNACAEKVGSERVGSEREL